MSNSTFFASSGEGYELSMGRWSRRLARPFVEFVGISDSDISELVLDVGSGTGHLASELVTRSNRIRVVGVDISPSYVEYAKLREDCPRAEFKVGDACALDFPDRTFDRVLSLLALHFVPRTSQAIAEMRRVAKAGAVVAAAVWDARGGFVANRMFFDTAAALDTNANARRARNYTRPLTRPGELTAAWCDAGFLHVDESLLYIRMEYASFSDYWAPFLGKDGPGAEYVGQLGPDERARLERSVRSAYLDGEPDGPRSYAALAWVVKGFAPL